MPALLKFVWSGESWRSTTVPFWAGMLVLLVPSAIMVLAVLGALPGWSGLLLLLMLLSLAVPAAGWTIAQGIEAWKEARVESRSGAGGLGVLGTRLAALASIVLALVVLAGTLSLVAWILLRIVVG